MPAVPELWEEQDRLEGFMLAWGSDGTLAICGAGSEICAHPQKGLQELPSIDVIDDKSPILALGQYDT